MKKTASGVDVHDWAQDFNEDGFQILPDGRRRDCRIWPWERPQHWEKADNYPDPKTASMDLWAWEFLKRNEQFRSEWESLLPLAEKFVREIETGEVNTADDELRNNYRRAKWEFFRKWAIKESTFTVLSKTIYDCFAPDSPVTFESSWVNPVSHAHIPELAVSGRGNSEFFVAQYSPEHAVLRFNLTWPIDPQIQAAKHYLEGYQRCNAANLLPETPKTTRIHRGKLLRYLRVWDAKKAGATDIKIITKLGSVLGADKNIAKEIENSENAAHRFINERGYILIALGSGLKKVQARKKTARS